MTIFTGLLFWGVAFVGIWWGASLIIGSVDRIAHKINVSSFAMSFFVLGLLTSIPETAVGITAIVNRKPEVFVGSLLGGTMVIFLLIIPMLAILGGRIKLNHDLNRRNILGLLAVMVAPSLMMVDGRVSNTGGVFLILAYLIIFFLIERRHGVLKNEIIEGRVIKKGSLWDWMRVVLGMGVVYFSSQHIVSQTIFFAQYLNVPAFYISLIVLSWGANLPEFSLAIKAVMSGKKEIAFGDYLGSAAANTLLFGVFTLVNEGETVLGNGFLVTFVFMIFGLGMFYFFSQTKKEISRREGFVLLLVYFVFVIYEVSKGVFAR